MWQKILCHCAVLTKVSEEFAPYYLAEIRHDMRQTTINHIFSERSHALLSNIAGFVANFAQEVMKGQLPLLVRGLSGEGVELFGRSAALCPLLKYQLPFLNHMHEFNTG